MAKVFLGVGHGGNDPGAVKYLVEKTVNLEIAKYCRDYLAANSVKVLLSREKDENDPLAEEIKECNAFSPDLAVDIHSNAGGGDGFEVYYYHGGGKSKELAQNIEKEVIAIGQNSRGCKTKLNSQGKDYFGFIRQTNAPAVIVEGFFVDNQNDSTQNQNKLKLFGEAYAKGILKTLGINTPTNHMPPNNNNHKRFKVQVGSFENLKHAENLKNNLSKLGFETFIVTE